MEDNNRTDVIFRLVGVAFGSVLYYMYTESLIGFVWSIGYVLCYALYWVYLHTRRSKVVHSEQVMAHLLVMLLAFSFMWLPATMLVTPDQNLFLSGAGLLGAQLMFLVHRGDTLLFLILGITGTVFATLMVTFLSFMPRITDPVGMACILISWLSLVYYLGQSLLAARARILAEDAARLQVYQSQKLASLGQLAGGIAHDFNNILTAISGNLELYHELRDPTDKDDVVRAAQASSQRAAKIVGQILIYARKSPVALQVVEANSPLDGISVLTAHLVPSNIHFDVAAQADNQRVRIDSDQMVTALMNLVLNAVDALENNGGRIEVRAGTRHMTDAIQVEGDRTLAPGSYVEYSVSDTGSGIPEEILANVADPFFTTKPVGKGTGLGLSMAVSIAESVEGGLAISSDRAGTQIRIFVPLVTGSGET